MADVAIDQQCRRQRAGQREGDLREAERDDQPADAHGRGQPLHEVIDGEGREATGGNARNRARGKFGIVAGADHLHEVGRDQSRHGPAHEGLDAEFLANAEQQHAHGGIGRIEGHRQPACLDRGQCKFGLERGSVGKQEAVLCTAHQRHEDTDGEIGRAARRGVIGIGRRAGEDRHLVRLEPIAVHSVDKGIAFGHGISAPSTSTSSSAAANCASSSMPPASLPRRSRRATVLAAE